MKKIYICLTNLLGGKMRKSLLQKLTMGIFTLVFLLLIIPNNKAEAQYCGFDATQYWNQYGIINSVVVTDITEGTVVIDRSNSGYEQWSTIDETGGPYDFNIGNSFELKVNWGVYYSGYLRAYLDKNDDQRWETSPRGPDAEFLAMIYNYAGFNYPAQPTLNNVIPFNVGDDVPEGPSVLRVIANYSGYYTDPCTIYGYPGYRWAYGEAEDYAINFVAPVPETFPTQGNILFNKQRYDGTQRIFNGQLTDFPLPSAESKGPQPTGTRLEYWITGPLPSNDVVYRALDPNTGSQSILYTSPTAKYVMGSATGPASVSTSEGTFKPSKGGEYKVHVKLTKLSGKSAEGVKVFTVANNYDMSVAGITSPRTSRYPRFFKYLRNTNIAVTCEVQNTGLNPVKKFEVTAKIYDADNDALVSTQPKVVFDSDNDPNLMPLQSGQKYEVNFAAFQTGQTGEYYIKFEVSYTFDEEEYNNTLPRPDGEKYYFEVQYNDQLTAGVFKEPVAGQVLKVNKPYSPKITFLNNGISDASNVNFHLIVKDNLGQEVYNDVSFLEDLPQGRYNERLVTFPNLIIRKPGTYTACAWVDYPYDSKHDDDTVCVTFDVELGIQGVITVGKLNEGGKANSTMAGSPKNFATVGDLMDALYTEGISGDVEFRFTDPEYVIDAPNAQAPAWDMSAKIIGVGPTEDPNDADGIYTITMRPANNRIAVRGGVKFIMNAASGMGVRFGHEIQPANTNAVIINFPERVYARSAGYITFDGGSQKCFEFELNTSNPIFGAAIYMQRGSSHIAIKNCLITNNSPQIKNSVSIPSAKFSENSGFTYDRDEFRNQLGQDISYSAGIVSRSTLIEATTFIGDLRDTLENHDNIIKGNDISGFGVGIIDIGLGVLRHDYSTDPNILDTLKSFYNYDNEISDNRIWDASRTGIFIGYTQDTKVQRNLIWDVNAPAGTMASGIEAGGVVASNSKGYHNIRLSLLGNRITDLTSNTNVTGIRVEQDRTIYETGADPKIFPRTDERTRIANNFIWGLNITNSSANRAGIHLLTQRAPGGDPTAPDVLSYVSRADEIVNNTIMIGSTGFANTGMTVGIGIQNTRFTKVLNNALSIVDPNINAATPIAADLLVQGNFVEDQLNIDRNVYWSGYNVSNLDNTNLDLMRYIEQDKNKRIVSNGYRLEYANLDQIQAATNTQNNSIYGNFLQDLELYQRSGVEPLLYRVKANPAPLNSILNNRGETINWLTTDFEGDLRGAAGQRYDIGADEFIGRLHIFDLSPVTILAPRSYRDITTSFADAEYIMTTAPIPLKVNVRNNGSIQQAGTKVYAKIYIENPDGTFNPAPILEKEVVTDIPSTNNVTVDFGLADGLDGDDWTPMSYDDLINAGFTGYENNIPVKFDAMSANVSPRYRIDILVGSDQENINNKYSKFVRFYLKKTNRNVLISSVNTTADPIVSPTAATVGRLNYDKIIEGFNTIGYKVESVSPDPVYDFDIFDRGSWEPRAVNYNMYNFLFYSDGYNVNPTRFEKLDLYSYLNAGSSRLKNTIVYASEEWSKLNTDADFQDIVLRSNYVNSNPLGTGASYDGNSIKGESISKDYVIPITRPMYDDNGTMTLYPNDVAPYPAVVTPRNFGQDGKPLQGLASAGYLFNLPSPNDTLIFGTATVTVSYNIIHNTVDWRNFGDIETIMRGTIDFLERNDASIVPVELADFNANQKNKSVVLDWSTASENGSSKFIVERASAKGDVVTGNFISTGLEVTAVGKSTQMNYYGPVVDNNVEYGQTYAYRLRTVDFDGTSDVSNQVRIVEIAKDGNFDFTGFTQNPASTTTELTFSSDAKNLTVEVVDMNGKVIFSDKVESKQNYPLNVSNFANGTYTVVLRSESGIQTKQLNVVR